MANITRRNVGQQNIGSIGQEWDPFRMMRQILQWDPFREMAPWTGGTEERGPGFVPQFEVKETKDAYIFRADLPGVKDEDLNISLTGNRLTVSGKREAESREEGETYFAYERSYGTFSRSFTLPDDVSPDDVRAELRHGVLTLHLGKKPEAQPKKISVKGTTESKGQVKA